MAANRFDPHYFDLEKPAGGGRGRPRVVLNEAGQAMVQKLASVACTDEEIALILNIEKRQLRSKWNKENYEKAKEQGFALAKLSLRRAQFEEAKKGNYGMLRWLGIQYLGQTDKKEIVDGKDKEPQELKITINPASGVKLEEEEGS